jgi:hypothetical protein
MNRDEEKLGACVFVQLQDLPASPYLENRGGILGVKLGVPCVRSHLCLLVFELVHDDHITRGIS